MDKPFLDAHTIKVMNEQGVAKKEGDMYINTRNQSYTGNLIFTFNRVPSSSMTSLDSLYKLSIVLETANGNTIEFKHKLSSDQIKPIYDHVSNRSDEAESRAALNLANELNSHYKQFDSIFD
ncbi:hypothetical protein VPH5P1C_0138 [Vibrio phage 5P1c]